MSEQKYIVTADEACEFDRIVSYPDDVHHPDCDVEWLKAHEYNERTCRVTAVRDDRYIGAIYMLSCGHENVHDGEGNPPRFCGDCGAKVVEE